MGQLADRFKLMMLDNESRLGASMIARGGCYWKNGSGGLAVSHEGTCIQLDARQASQIRTILPIENVPHAARLPLERVGPHLRDLLSAPLLPVAVVDRVVCAGGTNFTREREVCR